jgi:chemotaxis protein methyltransferase CheR
VEGDYVLTRRNLEEIADYIHGHAGIVLTEAKATLVYSRLAKRVRKLGLADFDQYCALVRSPEGAAERGEMLAALTTNLTRFFREPHHFDHFRRHVAPGLAAAARDGQRVRLWSAACSSGEEPYSMALTLLEQLPDAARHDVRILATDIDPHMVARARSGVYSAEAVSPIPAALRERYLRRDTVDGQAVWRVDDAVRALVTCNELNLIGPWPMKGRFDVVFCRNVVIYFDEATQVRLWSRFRDALVEGGRLYVGHSERVETPGFESDGLTVYRLAPEGRRR